MIAINIKKSRYFKNFIIIGLINSKFKDNQFYSFLINITFVGKLKQNK